MQMQQPSAVIEIRMGLKKLRKMDVLGKSDPVVVVYREDQFMRWEKLGETERKNDVVNCDFLKSVEAPFFFGAVQPLRFDVFDVDDDAKTSEAQTLIGCVNTTLGEIVGSTFGSMERSIIHPKHEKRENGLLIIAAEQRKASDVAYRVHFTAKKLDKKDRMGLSDPFFKIMRSRPDGKADKVHQSEVVRQTLEPTWANFEIGANALCGCDVERPLQIEVYDWDADGSEDFIGYAAVTVKDLRMPEGGEPKMFPLINPKLATKKKYVNSGLLVVHRFTEFIRPTFMSYLRGGCELSIAVSIDFSLSNGILERPNCLHRYTDQQVSEYEKAIIAIGDIVKWYDPSQLFPVWGFGGMFDGSETVSSLHPLNKERLECHGTEGIVASYRETLRSCKFGGPTKIAPTIEAMISLANLYHCEMSRRLQKYFILLILTDGEVTDMEQAVESVIRASNFPISIVIAGIGDNDWSKMRLLDCDEGRLKRGNAVAKRDCVQFVEVNKYKDNPAKLAHETLSEIPTHLIEYFKMRGIPPNPPLC